MNRRRAQAGFSLIEILLVVGIIAFIATMVATNIVGASEGAKLKQARAGVASVAQKINSYYLDIGSVPGSIDDLSTKPSNAANWKGPYLIPSQLLDPWKVPYAYKIDANSNQGFVVISYGPDKIEGGSEKNKDITSLD